MRVITTATRIATKAWAITPAGAYRQTTLIHEGTRLSRYFSVRAAHATPSPPSESSHADSFESMPLSDGRQVVTTREASLTSDKSSHLQTPADQVPASSRTSRRRRQRAKRAKRAAEKAQTLKPQPEPAAPVPVADTPSVDAKAPSSNFVPDPPFTVTVTPSDNASSSPQWKEVAKGKLRASDIKLQEITPARQMKIASLRADLDRVLFSPGIHHLRDPRSGVRNFGPTLDSIPKAKDFAVERTPQYVPPSQHAELLDLAGKSKSRFIGSTSTLTKAFSQIWFLISNGRLPQYGKFSAAFVEGRPQGFTAGAELPAALLLTPLSARSPADSHKIWAVDSSKAYDIANALSDYGRVLEKQLTAENADFARFLKSAPDSVVSAAERNEAEAYRYRKAGSILMRSQLDCHHPQLPGTGVFDIKTRACHPLRHDRANVTQASQHDMHLERGDSNTFERELYDLVRSAMLKYSMQVRIGDMDGIFLAYHNTSRMFGFQYLTLADMDEYLFGSSPLADQAFKLCTALFERILQHVTATVDTDEPVSLMLYHKPGPKRHPLNILYGPASSPNPTHGVSLTVVNSVNGQELEGEIDFGEHKTGKIWTTSYTLSDIPADQLSTLFASSVRILQNMCTLAIPHGMSVDEMHSRDKEDALQVASIDEADLDNDLLDPETESTVDEGAEQGLGKNPNERVMELARLANKPKVKVTWVRPNARISALRRETEKSRREYEQRRKGWIVKDEHIW